VQGVRLHGFERCAQALLENARLRHEPFVLGDRAALDRARLRVRLGEDELGLLLRLLLHVL